MRHARGTRLAAAEGDVAGLPGATKPQIMNPDAKTAFAKVSRERSMRITHAVESTQGSNAVRGGNREFKTLLRGDDESLGNYKLSFVRPSGELYVPRH
jgi:hypothetical protein